MTNQCSMGIGWIQTNNESIIHSFAAQIKYWPTSYKAELLAILSAISTAPRNCKINIFTDSQSVISKYQKLTQKPINPSHILSFNNWPIWHILLNLIKSFNFTLNLYKVQAHRNNTLNNKADSLAQNHELLQHLILNHSNIYNPYYYIKWQDFPVEQPTRRFIKNICNAHIIAT